VSAGRVLLWVQHMLGIGHVRRAALVSRAMAEAGLAVRFVTGGMPAPGIDPGTRDVVQLPPVRSADERFSAYLDEQGAPIDDAWRARRRDALLAAHAEFGPDAVVIESFPFARRAMRFELLPLLDACRDALVLSSVRDVVQAKRDPARLAETVELVLARFGHVLVHGDPDFIRFEESFGPAGQLAERLAYTGYVAPPAPKPAAERRGVVVSAGGGAVGGTLLEAALAARPRTRLAQEPWRLLAGHNLPEDAFAALQAKAPDGVTVERTRPDFPALLAGHNLPEDAFAALQAKAPDGVTVERTRPDFPALLAGARVSVSQAGYNTVMDLIGARVRAVLVPFAGAGETEQPLRAARLAERVAAQVVAEDGLGPERLAAAVDAALDGAPADAVGVDLDGAAETARLVAGWIGERRR